MMKKILFILLFSIPIITQALPVDSSIFKYFPLNVGNKWVWFRTQNYSPGPGYESLKLLSTQIIDGKLYFLGRYNYYYNGNQFYSNLYNYRIDSLTGNLFQSDSTGQNVCFSDSLNSRNHDSAYCTCPSNSWHRCDTGTSNIFNQNPQDKSFSWMIGFEGSEGRTYAKNFGLLNHGLRIATNISTLYLRGCIINGVLYGDTNMLVGINQISSEIPDKFSLSQNYPNPFNPTTKIKFAIPGASAAQTFLSVFDIQGKEVAILVNESLKPGTYEVEWDAASYPSGVYFYKLVASNVIETKKMVLIK